MSAESAGCSLVGGSVAEDPGGVVVVAVDVSVDVDVPESVSAASVAVDVVLVVEDVEEADPVVPSPAGCCPAGVHS